MMCSPSFAEGRFGAATSSDAASAGVSRPASLARLACPPKDLGILVGPPGSFRIFRRARPLERGADARYRLSVMVCVRTRTMHGRDQKASHSRVSALLRKQAFWRRGLDHRVSISRTLELDRKCFACMCMLPGRVPRRWESGLEAAQAAHPLPARPSRGPRLARAHVKARSPARTLRQHSL